MVQDLKEGRLTSLLVLLEEIRDHIRTTFRTLNVDELEATDYTEID